MKLLLLFLVAFFTVLSSPAQDVAGFWKGELTFVGGCFPKNNIELQLKTVGDGVYGSSYHYLDEKNYIRKEASGHYDAKTKKLFVQEGAVTAQVQVDRCNICVKKFRLTYRREGDKEYLEGFWTGKMQSTDIDCGTGGTITLSRSYNATFKEEQLPTVRVDTGEVQMSFYDNATVDGDSITVKVNNVVVLSKHRLSAVPGKATARISLDTLMVVVEMIAENLGSIPPNTAFMEVKSGGTYHRLNMVSTKTKSAKVRFIYDPEASKKPQVLLF